MKLERTAAAVVQGHDPPPSVERGTEGRASQGTSDHHADPVGADHGRERDRGTAALGSWRRQPEDDAGADGDDASAGYDGGDVATEAGGVDERLGTMQVHALEGVITAAQGSVGCGDGGRDCRDGRGGLSWLLGRRMG